MNAFVRPQEQFENARPILHVSDYGNAEKPLNKKLLNNRYHFAERARALADGNDLANAAFGGWLGRYHAVLETAIAVQNRDRTEREKQRQLQHER